MTHDLFTIPELCICIAEAVPDYSEHYLWNLDPKGPHLPTLASLAQVARVFKEPALSVLWRRLRNVIPVACLFPESVIAYNEEAKLFDLVEDVEATLCKTLPETRSLALTYMRRIRCVSYSEGHAVSQPVLAFLSRLGGPIFPRLQRLLCKTTSLKGAELLPLFLCPTLHTLLFGGAFVTVATAAEIIRTIETLPIAAPNLETFHLRNSTKSLFSSQDVLIDAISSSLPSLKRLKSIQLAYMPSIGSLLPTICLITRLEELYLKFNSNVTATVPELARDAFPTLKKLTIIGNMFVCTTIIDAFSTSKSCRLQELFLDIEWVPCVIATFDLGESIRTAFQLSLRALCIIADTLHPGILLTLFGCSRLEIVSVPLWMKGGGLDIALELVEMACKAWPQIKALNFQEIYESASENDSIVEDSNSDSDSNSENDMASYADADVEYSSGAEDDTDMDWDSDLDPGFAL